MVVRKADAQRALARGQPSEAVRILKSLITEGSGDESTCLALAAAHRACGDHAGALAAIDEALKRDARNFLALLMKATLIERSGNVRQAGRAYGLALTQVPSEASLDASTRRALQHGREVYRAYIHDMSDHVKAQVLRRGASEADSRRVDLFVDATLGTRKLYRQEPTEFCYPGLPAIEFYDRAEFPWLDALESATSTVREELLALVASDSPATPYVAYPDGLPLDQWAELNHSPRWGAYHFFHMGQRYDENCRRCPATMALLAGLPQPQVQGRMPAAMFSVLKARTRIPPHTGVANIRLVVHLPLIVPPGCGFRVGNESREWREGHAWVFDDTIEHEAWNDSDHDRTIMIFDVWNPRLNAHERDMIAEVMAAMDRFNETVPDSSL